MLDVKTLHGKSAFHKQAVLESQLCGCFHCLRLYPPSEITKWVERDEEQTAVCPYCSVDAVLPSAEVDLTLDLLKAMQTHWFARGH